MHYYAMICSVFHALLRCFAYRSSSRLTGTLIFDPKSVNNGDHVFFASSARMLSSKLDLSSLNLVGGTQQATINLFEIKEKH